MMGCAAVRLFHMHFGDGAWPSSGAFRRFAVLAALLASLSGCVADLAQIQATGSVPLSGRSALDLCDAAIRERAAQYDPVSIETSLTEPVRQWADGGQVATL